MMEDEPRVFKYRLRTVFPLNILPLVSLVIAIPLFVTVVVGSVFSGALTEKPMPVFVSIGGFFVIIAFFVSSYVVGAPQIVVDDDKFRIQKPFFKSRWFEWESIHHIENASNTIMFGFDSHVRLLCVSGLGPLAWLSAIMSSSCRYGGFYVGPTMKDSEIFWSILQEKRPDLFPDNISK